MNFYEYLGLTQKATEDDIKKAFRNKAKKIHPDYNKKNSAFYEMVELNLIRDTLLNPEKRIAYDAALHQGMAGAHLSTQPSPRQSKLHSIYKVMRELFVYRCRICGLEMSSTWQGYCLYHFLEVSGQLNNQDHTFHYHGYTFHWQAPNDTGQLNRGTHRHTTTKGEYFFFTFTLMIVVALIIVFAKYYWLI